MHSFSNEYAAGVYVYLWSDVMAADIAEAFLQSPGGLYDEKEAERWRTTMLGVGSRVPADEAFRNFRGRDPDPGALLRRFGLEAPAAAPAPRDVEPRR
jgi:peptidyl-dipeptidase Dcp